MATLRHGLKKMLSKKNLSVVIGLWLCGFQVDASAQSTSNWVLADLDSVNATVNLTWDDQIQGFDESMIRSRLQTVLELTLRRDGILVSGTATVFLVETITVNANAGGADVFSHRLQLYEPGYTQRAIAEFTAARLAEVFAADSTPLTDALLTEALLKAYADAQDDLWATDAWVTSWEAAGELVRVGRLNLQTALEQKVAEDAEVFINAYLDANR